MRQRAHYWLITTAAVLLLLFTLWALPIGADSTGPVHLQHSATQIDQAHRMALDLRAFSGVPYIDGAGGLRQAAAPDVGAVSLTGAEPIAGVKTFSSFPVTPSSAPTTDYQVANKKYVDDHSGGATLFTDLTDTPSTFSGAGSYFVRVNSGATALEFLPQDPDLTTLATGAADSIVYYDQFGAANMLTLGASGYVLKSQGTGAPPIFAAITPNEIGAQSQDPDLDTLAGSTPWMGFYRDGSGVMQEQPFGTAGYVWTSNGPTAAPTWQPASSGGALTFLGLTDTPSDYTGHALEYARVNSAADGIEFVAGTPTPWMYPITKDSPTASTYRWFKADAALTVTGFDVIEASTDTGTITVDVQECTATGTSCVSIFSAPVTATATGAAATISDTSIAADAWVQIVYGTPSGTVTQVAATLKGTR